MIAPVSLAGCVIAGVLLVVIGLPCINFALQVLLGAAGRRSAVPPGAEPDGPRPTLAVLVPAHNEAAGIVQALAPLMAQMQPGDRVLVIADNCEDDTARVARSAGAEVTVRYDPARRGKGHALAHGVEQLRAAPPDVVLIVDADCIVGPHAVGRLVRQAHASQRPVQAAYLIDATAEGALPLRVSRFAWRVKNLVRPRGLHRLHLPCPLTGSGMAFPWHLLEQARLASSHLVEDLQLGLELARRGSPPQFCEAAQVTSSAANTSSVALAQRARWEHGHLASMKAVPGLVWRALLRADMRLLSIALDLAIPPLALLALASLAATLLSALYALISGQWAPLAVAAASTALLFIAILHAWWHAGRDLVSAAELVRLPMYAAWKLPLYLKYVFDRQVEWVRTLRH